jgi:UDPglucose 6-dehydrogenase
MKNLCVIGTGYVGLVGAAVFSEWGNNVVGVDIDKEKIKSIEQGVMPIYEPGLEEVVAENISKGRLKFTTKLKEGVKDADIVFICVGTPQSDTGHADLSYVWQVAEELGELLKKDDKYRVVVTKSTVPIGTNERVKKIISEKAPGAEFDVASNPEFLREGVSVEDMRNPDRTVIGSDSEKALVFLAEMYEHIESAIVKCDLRSAEMIKYASNAFLATKISFINEIGQLCKRAGADVAVVADGMGLDKRIGRHFLNVSVGYGGSCFPKDVAALYKTSTDQAYDFKLLRSVMEVNELQKYYYLREIKSVYGENLSGLSLACLGLAFKNDTDDIRESVAIKIIKDLRGMGASLRVYDPQAMENAKDNLGDDSIYYAKDEYDAVRKADGLCLLTEWSQFRGLDIEKTKKLIDKHYIFDGRNLLNQKEVEDAGFVYFALGKRTNGYNEGGEIVATAVLRNGKN